MIRRNSMMVSKALYQIGVATVLMAIIWVGIGVYLTLNKTVNSDVDKTVLEPINPNIDPKVIELLSGRIVVESIVPVSTLSATISATIDVGEPQ